MRKFAKIAIVIIAIASSVACSKAKKDATDVAVQEEIVEPPRNIPEGAIEFDYGGHLYFDVMLHDTIPAKMAFDTGNTNMLIDLEFYNQHFDPANNLQRAIIQGAGNSFQAVYRDNRSWKYCIGKQSQTEQGVVVMNLRKILGDHVDGMFGMVFMQGKKVELNYIDRYMRIMPQDEQPTEGYTCIKCQWLDKRQSRMVMPLTIKVANNLALDGRFLVDLGASDAIALNSNTAARMQLNRVLTDVKKKMYDTGGVGGSRTDYIFRGKSITAAEHEIENIYISYSGNTQGAMADNRYDGLVGNALFERFDVIIDFARCEIWLRPNKNINAEIKFDSGMTLTPKTNCWIVNGLIEGGNAHKAGVKRGDVIISINGLSPEKIDIRRLRQMNRSAEDWTIVVKRDNINSEITFEKEQR